MSFAAVSNREQGWTAVEQVVADIWGDLLGQRPGPEDDFFELGGNSLLALRVSARLRDAVGVTVPMTTLFQASTVGALARAVEEAGPVQLRRGRSGATGPRGGSARRKRVPASPPGLHPLSYAQERLWFMHRMDPDSAAYHIPWRLRLEGPVDVEALGQALQGLVARHESLRTVFAERDGEPFQVVRPAPRLEVPCFDLQGEPAGTLDRLQRALAQRPFNLAEDVLLRPALYRLGPQSWSLLMVFHHVAVDGWSLNILMEDLGQLYSAALAGRTASLLPPSRTCVDFAHWQRDQVQAPQALEYWRERLQGAPPVIELPLDRPRPAVGSDLGGRAVFPIPPALDRALRDLGRCHGATPFMTYLAAFLALLRRETAETDIVVGTPVSGRSHPDTHGLVGFLANSLVLRTDCSGDPDFVELLGRVREVSLGAYAHADVPFERLVEALRPDRDLSCHPLFQVAFSMATLAPPHLAGVSTSAPEDVDLGAAKFDLMLTVVDRGDETDCCLEYRRDIFDDDTIQRVGGRYVCLLQAIVDTPGTSVTKIPLLSAEEAAAIERWTTAHSDYPSSQCMHELFEEQVRRHATAIALVEGEETVTYAELNRRANQVAWRLREQGVGADDVVAVTLPRSIDLMVALVGIIKAGAAYLALDPAWPMERRRALMDDAAVKAVVGEGALYDDRPSPDPQPVGGPDRLAYVCFTSGSTGKPKGVAVAHRGVVRTVRNVNYAVLDDREVFLQMAPIAFDASTFEVWGALLNGARLVVMPAGPVDLETLGASLGLHDISTLWLTTGLFNVMVEERVQDLQGLRQLLFGGEAASPEHVERARIHLPGVRLVNMYGPTENTTFSTFHAVDADRAVDGSLPIGRPVSNASIFILDEHRQPVPIGVPGEIYVGGDGVARGYVNRAELTAERFLDDDLRGRLYRTGDRGRWRADGSILFLGRVDRQLKVRGYRIEPGEIEAVMARHEAVRQCLVTGLPDRASGGLRLVAFVVLDGGTPAAELRRFMKERLPDYMVPTLRVVDHLPLNANGKVDVSALTTAPEVGPDDPSVPADSLEQQLAQVWQEVLKVPQVGIHDRFFDLGGHSLLGARLVSRMEQLTGYSISLSTLFEAQTVAQMARRLRDGAAESWTSVVPLQAQGVHAPIFWVHTLGGDNAGGFSYYRRLVELLGPDQPSYGIRAPAVPFDCIERMSADYIEQVLRIQPRGPYYLGGFCIGGTIAFEMGRQMHDRGLDVRLVVAIDTGPGTSAQASGAAAPVGTRLLAAARRVRDMLDADQRPLLGKRVVRFAQRCMGQSPQVRLEDLVNMSAYPPDYVETARVHYAALQRYVPKPWPGRVALVRCAQPPWEMARYEDYGWGRLALGGVDAIKIPTDHDGILEEPNVRLVADGLRQVLSTARARPPAARR